MRYSYINKLVLNITLSISFLLPFTPTFANDGETKKQKKKTNVVIFYADDLGWGDLSINGGKTPTPNIDKIFSTGIQLTNYNTHCVCSPSRAGLLTGKHYVRTNSGPKTGGELALDEKTMAETFQDANYKTGAFGKWHNGAPTSYGEKPTKKYKEKFDLGHGVNAHGFDRFVGYYGGGSNYFNRYSDYYGQTAWYHDKEQKPDEKGYTTDLITQHAIDFIEANKKDAFFCYIPHETAHNPLNAKFEDIQRVPKSVRAGAKLLSEKEYMSYFKNNKDWKKLPKKQLNIVRSAMLISLDDGVGKVIDYLKKEKILDNTIILFTSDNGATPEGNNLPFRGGKHSVYEGGIHVPAALMWKNGGLNRGEKYHGDISFLDIYPTVATMAGVERNKSIDIDGKDLSAEIVKGNTHKATAKHWVWTREGAVKEGKWKLIYNLRKMQLFNLEKDISEENNLAKSHPKEVERLKRLHEEWLKENGVKPSYIIPADENIKPKPEGEVLEFYVEQVKDIKKAKDGLRFVFALGYPKKEHVEPGDVIEYDICVAEDGQNKGFYYTPSMGWTPFFYTNTGYDQYGRLQTKGPRVKAGKEVWEHRVVGIGELTPSRMPFNMISFTGKEKGVYHFYLDNIVVKKADGRVFELWKNGKNTFKRWNEKPFMMTPNNDAYQNLSVKAIQLDNVK